VTGILTVMEKEDVGSVTVAASSAPIIAMLKKPWVVTVGFIAALALLLTNINSILANVRALPGEIKETSEQFYEWYGDYQLWKGHWTNFPEGRVDMAELRLSKEDFHLSIDDVTSGVLVGSIETKKICAKLPFLEQLLFDGKISSSRRANISVFDYIGGYRKVFATLNLRREAGVMIITPDDDPMGLFSTGTRIALDPNKSKGEFDQQQICARKSETLIKHAIEAIRPRQHPVPAAR
jgi:hypothetical protein